MGECDVLGVKAFLRYDLAVSGISYDDLEPKNAGHRTLKSHIETIMFLNKISVEELKKGSHYMLPENSQGELDDAEDNYNKKMMKKKMKMKMKKKMMKKKKKNDKEMADGDSMAETTMMLKNVMSYRIKETKKIYKQLGIPWTA